MLLKEGVYFSFNFGWSSNQVDFVPYGTVDKKIKFFNRIRLLNFPLRFSLFPINKKDFNFKLFPRLSFSICS